MTGTDVQPMAPPTHRLEADATLAGATEPSEARQTGRRPARRASAASQMSPLLGFCRRWHTLSAVLEEWEMSEPKRFAPSLTRTLCPA